MVLSVQLKSHVFVHLYVIVMRHTLRASAGKIQTTTKLLRNGTCRLEDYLFATDKKSGQFWLGLWVALLVVWLLKSLVVEIVHRLIFFFTFRDRWISENPNIVQVFKSMDRK